MEWVEEVNQKELDSLIRGYRRAIRSVGEPEEGKAVELLRSLVLLMEEWQIDWPAISPVLKSGRANPDFEDGYLKRVENKPETVFDPRVIEARKYLESKGVLGKLVKIGGTK